MEEETGAQEVQRQAEIWPGKSGLLLTTAGQGFSEETDTVSRLSKGQNHIQQNRSITCW